jgi:hypothetical protein
MGVQLESDELRKELFDEFIEKLVAKRAKRKEEEEKEKERDAVQGDEDERRRDRKRHRDRRDKEDSDRKKSHHSSGKRWEALLCELVGRLSRRAASRRSPLEMNWERIAIAISLFSHPTPFLASIPPGDNDSSFRVSYKQALFAKSAVWLRDC